MTPGLVFIIIIIYFSVLILFSLITSTGADTATFFTGNRQSPRDLVAFGIIGFHPVRNNVYFSPVQFRQDGIRIFSVVLGYLLGYRVIIGVLMPLHYRLNPVSIYTHLETRFSFWSYRRRSLLSYFKNHRLRPPAISGNLHPAADEKSNIIILK